MIANHPRRPQSSTTGSPTAGSKASPRPPRRPGRWLAAAAAVCLVVTWSQAVPGSTMRRMPHTTEVLHGEGSYFMPFNAREAGQFGTPFPEWENDQRFKHDTFTFARLRYPSRRREAWRIDYPDSDLNFSFRLQQLTALETNPNPVVVDIEAETLRHYPFIYMVEPGDIDITPQQAQILRDYLLNGGFMMVDDFWGYREWNNFEYALRMIFPDRTWTELELDHPIFNLVFKLDEKPQVPDLHTALRYRPMGITYEAHKEGAEHASYRAIYDDDGRMCVLACWNTDLGDGWEREGDNEWYFRTFSEAQAFPIGINIVVYVMTH